MSDTINIQSRFSNLDISPQFDGYSKVIINKDENTSITVGNDSGRTLEFDNPFGTYQMAQEILTKLQGFQYQPYTAEGAILDPTAEIGDGVTARNTYGGLYTRKRTFSRLMKADIGAPTDEEIDHEYKYESPKDRKIKRDFGNVRASLMVLGDRITAEVEERTAQGEHFTSQLELQADQIAAKVESSGGSSSSFGWVLNDNSHTWYANGSEVMKVSASGLTVKGKVEATEGHIGGFTISASAIYKNISRYGGTQSSGVYIGTDGIQLGQGFKVDSLGNLYATSGTFTGQTYAKNIQYGSNATGYLSGSGISSGSVTTSQLSSYCSSGVSGGNGYTSATTYGTSSYPTNFTCGNMYAKYGAQVGNYRLGTETIQYIDWNNNQRSKTVWTAQT